MSELRRIHLEECQPSQLLVDAGKLRDVLEWLDADEPSYDPCPILEAERLSTGPDVDLAAPYVLADGHTRALAAVLCGEGELLVRGVTEGELADFDLEVYATCVGWCLEEGVRDPSDLVGRVVSSDTHRTEWIERCRALETEDQE